MGTVYGVHKHSSFIRLHKETVAFLWSLNFFLTDISALPTPTSASLRITRNKPLTDLCYFWGVYFCPLTIRTNYSPWKQRRETPIYFCIPPSFHLFVSPFPNGEQTPSTPPCLIVHIVIGDISINLVICSWVCLLCFPSSICSFCNYFFSFGFFLWEISDRKPFLITLLFLIFWNGSFFRCLVSCLPHLSFSIMCDLIM